ncbi:hypothetical protein EON80_20625 [bacterium]|nr:MAG: hypothetical protein EON80_20625 [bacterium]
MKKIERRFSQLFALGVVAGGALALAAPAAHATPSVGIFYPSTETLKPKQGRVSSDLLSRDMKTTTYGSGGLGYGLGSGSNKAFGQAEIGVDYVAAAPVSNVNIINRFRFNGKAKLFGDRAGKTTVVGGFWGVGSRGTVGVNSALPPEVVYLLASRKFKRGSIQAGLARSLAKKIVIQTPGGNSDRTYLQLGFKQSISRRVDIGIDYYSGKSRISALAPGLEVRLNDHANFKLGYIRYNDQSIAPSRNQVYVLIDYVFGGEGDDEGTTPSPLQ